jgi:hypothetical protein
MEGVLTIEKTIKFVKNIKLKNQYFREFICNKNKIKF